MSNDYSQPDFYHFNEDSIKLVKYVLEKNIHANTVLDACAGCGIVGLEYAQEKQIKKLVFVEVQTEFEDHLRKNIKQFLPRSVDSEISINRLSEFRVHEKFDLILSNPPYYLPNAGVKSPNAKRAIARSFILDGHVGLMEFIERSLAPQGAAFVVLKKDEQLINILKQNLPEGMRMSNDNIDDLMIVCFEYILK